MAHLTSIEDADGQLIDYEYFCSDFCARQSQYYDGWFGAQELEHPEYCHTCDKALSYVGDYVD